ncbi:MAG: amidohydrolase [Clostridia bacterium]|nr:amidohydrolase [Clostridia bacterium]
MSISQELILSAARHMQDDLIHIFRELHRHPEIAHHEIWTHQFIRSFLDQWAIPYLSPAPNITIAILESGKEGATVGLRCDTDALPVQEETSLPYASQIPGMMHACGHDAHTAIGLGTARLLKESMGKWQGKAKIIFQPAEEGEGGADEVLETGLVNDVDVFFSIHVWSHYPAGTLRAAAVPVSAAVNMFTIHLLGKGGHGATPEKCHDALVAGAELVSALQTLVSRRVSPMEPALLTIGSFHAGTVGNIVAEEAVLKGTFRSLNEETRLLLEKGLSEMTHQIAAAHHCTAEIDDRRLSDAVINDPKVTELAKKCARGLVPDDCILGQDTRMLGDDFANYGRIAPYCYAQVGIADEKKQTHYAHHNSRFAMDEDMLPICVAWMASFAINAGAEWKK